MSTFIKYTLVFLVSALGLQAFPPAPYYTLYGIVRDQVGQTVTAEGAEIILLKDGVEIGRAPINSNLRYDRNYEIALRIDQNRGGTTLYSDQAVAAHGLFSLAVEMNGSRFYPIEVSGNLTAGKGGERVQLDLNLGIDSDGDGLPDIWEQWQLYAAGYYPDANGVWPIHLITRDGDFNGDGQSNWFKYVSGTFAGDAEDKLELVIKDAGPTEVRLEFFGITGKTYTIERSADLANWEIVSFAIGAPGIGVAFHRAPDSGIVSVFTPRVAGSRAFYRLTVR